MQAFLLALLLILSQVLYGQSKSITRFRADHKENTNMFFYKSTLRMLNPDNNPQLTDLTRDIEEIRVLNYDKQKQVVTRDDIGKLKKTIMAENYNSLMMMKDKGNTIDLYSREKHGRTTGFIAVVDNPESLILIDLTGNIDVKKFMELKKNLDSRMEANPQ
jgi:hypothetical protein